MRAQSRGAKVKLISKFNIRYSSSTYSIYIQSYSVNEKISLSIKELPLYFLTRSKLIRKCLSATFTRYSVVFVLLYSNSKRISYLQFSRFELLALILFVILSFLMINCFNFLVGISCRALSSPKDRVQDYSPLERLLRSPRVSYL